MKKLSFSVFILVSAHSMKKFCAPFDHTTDNSKVNARTGCSGSHALSHVTQERLRPAKKQNQYDIRHILFSFFVTRQNHLPKFSRLKCLKNQSACSRSSALLPFLFEWLKSTIYEATNINGRSLLNRPICIVLRSYQQNRQSLKSRRGRKLISARCARCFLHYYAFEHLIRRNQPEFAIVWSGLQKYHPRKKEYFRKLSNGCF